MVRVYISVDMEGVAGISHANPTRRGDYGYAEAVALMVGEANAAIEGAFDGGATAVTVNDSHGGMYNLTPEALDRRARVVAGQEAAVDERGSRRRATSTWRCSWATTRARVIRPES